MINFIIIETNVIISEGLINNRFNFIITFITRFTGLLKRDIIISFNFTFIMFEISAVLKEDCVNY